LSKAKLHVIDSSVSDGHHIIKRGSMRDFDAWINYWNIKEDNQINDINNIKSCISMKFKDKAKNNLQSLIRGT
jgi:hypothetical protein